MIREDLPWAYIPLSPAPRGYDPETPMVNRHGINV